MDDFVSFTLDYSCPFLYAVYSSLVYQILPFYVEDGTNQSAIWYLNTDYPVAKWPGMLKYECWSSPKNKKQ